MALPTVSEFRAFFPEFAHSPVDAVIGLRIAAAARELDEEAFGAVYNDAVLWLAAHSLASTVFGTDAKLEANAPLATRYKIRFDEIRKSIGPQTLVL